MLQSWSCNLPVTSWIFLLFLLIFQKTSKNKIFRQNYEIHATLFFKNNISKHIRPINKQNLPAILSLKIKFPLYSTDSSTRVAWLSDTKKVRAQSWRQKATVTGQLTIRTYDLASRPNSRLSWRYQVILSYFHSYQAPYPYQFTEITANQW